MKKPRLESQGFFVFVIRKSSARLAKHGQDHSRHPLRDGAIAVHVGRTTDRAPNSPKMSRTSATVTDPSLFKS